MTPARKAHLQIHFCVLLWGVTAILGKLITLAALPLVWWRMLLVSVTLLCLPRVWRSLRALPPRLLLSYAGIGVIVSLHWLTFYGAIKLANASVAATCIALCPAFLSIVEPWVAGKRFDARELLIGAAVVPGVALVAGGVPGEMRIGLAVGVLSAIFVAFFSALNKRLVDKADALTVTCIELGSGTLFLTLLAPFMAGPLFPVPDLHDGVLIVLLAYGCTLLPFVLALTALRHLTAFATQMVTNLEPVYAILLAIPLLGEQRELGWAFYVGVAIILGAVFAHPFLHRGEVAGASDLVVP
ncbi:DMT family transporter [Xanthomonas sp. NCPPB 2632]|jgi:drug/metabolite transporter (DMT)-like permease|uniref:DMT family transporter n=1 Tax=Xanthomonas sp. NCPPB 2632 TaxID=3240912 RepID=UPI0035188645